MYRAAFADIVIILRRFSLEGQEARFIAELHALKRGREPPLEFTETVRSLVNRAYPSNRSYHEIASLDDFTEKLGDSLQTSLTRSQPKPLNDAV
ncbi:unnamed protein product [Soboliphyme baturini]|uniref:Retrotrans_gag domain-containing protein n=1 Tax=Soboliphyme baturini TaxID=241478 RepID=A0A183IFI4_9BILA|nr:unnamed protein product [Soboliphyme baturini]